MSAGARWAPPSAAAAELMRAVTTEILLRPEPLFDEVDAAVLASQPDSAVGDPEVAGAIRTSNRANMAHWATATLADPGARVPPYRGPETLEIGREIVRRGLDDTSLESYRVGQNVVWRHWMRTAFALADDPEPLREMLEVSARSIFAFVDDTLALIHTEMEHERAQLVGRTHSERLEVVNLILEHAPITLERASARLRYDLGLRHTAAVVWSEGVGRPALAAGELEAAAEALARAAGAARPLTVAATATTLWVWWAGGDALDPPGLRAALEPAAGVRAALGAPASGIDGFRRSHLQALATQRLMRRMPSDSPVVGYGEVRLAALAGQDEAAAAEFVAAVLGELAGAEETLRETVRSYARSGFNVSAAARALYTHRNTVQGRLARAQELLPVPLDERGLEVGLALELVHWLGPFTAPPRR
jgi:DNA-binding PucR family transcriptional regulator